MPLRARWRQEIDDAQQIVHATAAGVPETRETVDARSRATKAQGLTPCYNCGHVATRWIRSAAQYFSAPRCDVCGERLVANFTARGVKDVKVDTISYPVAVGAGGAQ
jgi:hypothetical protein